jgi:peptidyl-dipeptidase Dcp
VDGARSRQWHGDDGARDHLDHGGPSASPPSCRSRALPRVVGRRATSGETARVQTTLPTPSCRRAPFRWASRPSTVIEPDHFGPAFERGMREQRDEIDRVAAVTDAPTFENVFVPARAIGAASPEGQVGVLQPGRRAHERRARSLRTDLSPKLSAHSDAILLDERLFSRIAAVHEQRDDPDARPRVAKARRAVPPHVRPGGGACSTRPTRNA